MPRWTSLPLDRLPALGDAWREVNFFAAIPRRLQGRLLLEMYRHRTCLVDLPDQGPLLLLRMRESVMLLQRASRRIRAIAGQAVREGNTWILALQPSASGGDFPAGVLELTTNDGLRIGSEGLELKQMPPFRPWSWRWNPTCGCGVLNVHVCRSADEIREWMHANPHLDANRKPAVGDGVLVFSTRRYHGLSRQEAGYDHAILALLAEGALGELSFDLIDTDYGALRATGHSCTELAAYLDPACSWNEDRTR